MTFERLRRALFFVVNGGGTTIERERARKRQVASLKKGEERPVKDKWPEREAGQTRDKVAQAVGMGSGKT